jgi:uncharacterized membrane protein YgcG
MNTAEKTPIKKIVGGKQMKYIIAIFIILALVSVFITGLTGVGEYGSSGLIMAGLAGYALYKIGKLIYDGYNSDGTENRSSGNSSYRPSAGGSYSWGGGGSSKSDKSDDPLEFMIFEDLMDDWDD